MCHGERLRRSWAGKHMEISGAASAFQKVPSLLRESRHLLAQAVPYGTTPGHLILPRGRGFPRTFCLLMIGFWEGVSPFTTEMSLGVRSLEAGRCPWPRSLLCACPPARPRPPGVQCT